MCKNYHSPEGYMLDYVLAWDQLPENQWLLVLAKKLSENPFKWLNLQFGAFTYKWTPFALKPLPKSWHIVD